MHVRTINEPLLKLPVEHPARRFLESFIECRERCVGLELPPPVGIGVDQLWHSQIEGKSCTYSSFAYSYLAFDIELDGWLTNASHQTEAENAMLSAIPQIHSLAWECRDAAMADRNQPIVEATENVLEMLQLWKECLESREVETSRNTQSD